MLLYEMFADEIAEADLTRRGFLGTLAGAGLASAGAGLLPDRKAAAPDAAKPAPAQPGTDELGKFIKDQPADIPASPEAKKQYGPSTSTYADVHNQSILSKYAQSQGIKGIELAALLAQSATETASFTRLVEKGDKSYFHQYDGKLGNDRPGDGFRYRGRGFLHITGKYWYNRIGKEMNMDLVRHPELLERPDVAAKASVIFWIIWVRPYVSDFNNVTLVTKRVNGGTGALEDREANFADYRKKLKV